MPHAMTDAIPLLNADGTARNNAKDMRTQLFAGLLAPDSNGVGIRAGVVPRNYTADHFVDMKIISLLSPGSAVQIYPGRCWVMRPGQGPYLCTQETTVSNYVLPSADPTNPRIDIMFVRLYDHAIGDSTGGPHGPYIDHLLGTPAGTPAAPSFPADTVPLAQILRPANVSTITNAEITDMRKGTSLLGAPRILLPGDSTSDSGLFVSEVRRRMSTAAQIAAGATPYVDEIWAADGTWKYMNLGSTTQSTAPFTSGAHAGGYSHSRSGGPAVGVSFVAPTSGKVNIIWSCGILPATAGSIGLCSYRIGTGSTINGGTEIEAPSDSRAIQHGAASNMFEIQAGRTIPKSGLTPGSIYNVCMYFRGTAAGATFSRVAIAAEPVW